MGPISQFCLFKSTPTTKIYDYERQSRDPIYQSQYCRAVFIFLIVITKLINYTRDHDQYSNKPINKSPVNLVYYYYLLLFKLY